MIGVGSWSNFGVKGGFITGLCSGKCNGAFVVGTESIDFDEGVLRVSGSDLGSDNGVTDVVGSVFSGGGGVKRYQLDQAKNPNAAKIPMGRTHFGESKEVFAYKRLFEDEEFSLTRFSRVTNCGEGVCRLVCSIVSAALGASTCCPSSGDDGNEKSFSQFKL